MALFRTIPWLLAALLVLSAVPARAEWREASSAHFLVYGDISASKLREYSERLERYDSALRLITNHAETGASSRRSEEHTSELQSLMRISYAVFCLKKKHIKVNYTTPNRY